MLVVRNEVDATWLRSNFTEERFDVSGYSWIHEASCVRNKIQMMPPWRGTVVVLDAMVHEDERRGGDRDTKVQLLQVRINFAWNDLTKPFLEVVLRYNSPSWTKDQCLLVGLGMPRFEDPDSAGKRESHIA